MNNTLLNNTLMNNTLLNNTLLNNTLLNNTLLNNTLLNNTLLNNTLLNNALLNNTLLNNALLNIKLLGFTHMVDTVSLQLFINIFSTFRLLSVSGKRISKICKEDHLISSLLKEELRLEEIPESEEDIEMEFTKVLASVVLDSAYLARRGVSTHPFLLVVDRSDAGDVIRNKICERLKITDDWKHKVWYYYLSIV